MGVDKKERAVNQTAIDRRRDAFYQAILGIKMSFSLLHAADAIRRELRVRGLAKLRPQEVHDFLEDLVSKGELRYVSLGDTTRRYIWVN